MNIQLQIALGGGFLTILTLIHFASDFFLQSHSEAMVKHNQPWIRAKHCFIYAISFIPFLWVMHFTMLEWIISLNILFWTHFAEDTYFLIYLWAKYVRRPPEMTEPWQEEYINSDHAYAIKVHPPDAKRGFGIFANTILGKILLIVTDQVVHIICLIPIVYIASKHVKW